MTNFTKVGTPKKVGEYFYFNYVQAKDNQAITYRVRSSETKYIVPDGNPLKDAEVFINPNTLSQDGKSILSQTVWSKDKKHLAYQVKRAGSDWS